jgi:small GTP-binding protein
MDKKIKVFLFGLDNAGKTSLLKYLKEEKVDENQSPTREFDVIKLVIEKQNFFIWDAPGQVKYREKWERGVLDSDLLLFVVDTADNERFDEVKMELDIILNKLETKGVPLIVCFHKIDLENAKENLKDASKVMKLRDLKERTVNWLKTSVISEEGIEDLEKMIYFSLVLIETQMNLDSVQKKYNDME